MIRPLLSIVLAAFVLATPPARAEGELAIRRFALIAGANDGGPSRERLRYAASHANSFARVLEELGGVAAHDRVVLLQPSRAAFTAGLEQVRALLLAQKASAARTELIVYYSGHSDDEGLLLSGERLPYDELRRALETLPADVRIAILDSCQSGALTRQKGGVMRAPFLMDRSAEVRGHAILTSSAEDEAAQESDRIGASFFTHYLVSGLRGAADTTNDGKVTLNEAYHFAFSETLSRTQKTRSGPQHAAYDIQLAGTGDLVMTDLRGTPAGLLFADAVAGRLFIRDEDGRLVAELYKTPGRVVELGLEAGTYLVTLQQDGLLEAEVEIPSGGRATLSLAEMQPVSAESTVSRGGPERDVTEHPIVAQLFPGMPSLGGADRRARANVLLGLTVTDIDELRGFALSPVGNITYDAVTGGQVAGAFNVAASVPAGAQIAGAFNVASDAVEGAQIAGAVNWAGGAVRGAQIASTLNHAGDLAGAQIGVINIGGDVRGAQIGVVNIASHVSGAQIGVVNVADDVDGLPLGLVSILRRGKLQLDTWTSTTEPLNLALRLRGRHVYTFVTGGFFDLSDSDVRADEAYLGVGVGGQVRLPRELTLELDGMAADPHISLDRDRQALFTRARLSLALQLREHLGVFAGLSYNAFFGFAGHDNEEAGRGVVDWVQVDRDGDFTMRQWPGLHVGLRL